MIRRVCRWRILVLVWGSNGSCRCLRGRTGNTVGALVTEATVCCTWNNWGVKAWVSVGPVQRVGGRQCNTTLHTLTVVYDLCFLSCLFFVSLSLFFCCVLFRVFFHVLCHVLVHSSFLFVSFFLFFSGLAKGTEKHKNHAWDPTLHLCTCGEQALIKVDAMSGLVLLVRPLDHSTESIALFMGKGPQCFCPVYMLHVVG